MNQYGLWRVSDLMDFEDPPPRHPVDVLVVEQIDFNNDHNLRFLRFVETPVKPLAHASGSRKRRLGFFPCCGGPRGRTTPERSDEADATAGAEDASSGGSHSNGHSSGVGNGGGGGSSRGRTGVAAAPMTPSRRNLMGARRFQTPAHHHAPDASTFEAVPEGLLGDDELAEESSRDMEREGSRGSDNGVVRDGGSGDGGGVGSNSTVEEPVDDSPEQTCAQAPRAAAESELSHASSGNSNEEEDRNRGALRAEVSSTPVSSGLEQDVRVSISSSSSHSDHGSNEDVPSGLSNTANLNGWPAGPINLEENHVTKLLFSLFDGAPAQTAEGTAESSAESSAESVHAPTNASNTSNGPTSSSSGDNGGSEWFGADPIKWFESLKANAPVSPMDALKGGRSSSSTSDTHASSNHSSSSSSKAPGSAPTEGIFGMTWPSPFPSSPKASTEEGWMANMFRMQRSDNHSQAKSPASTPSKENSATPAATPEMLSKATTNHAPVTPAAMWASPLAAESTAKADSATSRGTQQRSRSVSLASFGSESSDNNNVSDDNQGVGNSSGSEADLVIDASRAAPLQQDALLDSYFDASSPAAASTSQLDALPSSSSSSSSSISSSSSSSSSSSGNNTSVPSETGLSSSFEQPAESPQRPPTVFTSPASTRRRMSWGGAEDSFMSPGSSHSAGSALGNGGGGGSHSFKSSGYGSGLRGGTSRMSSVDARPRSSSTAAAASNPSSQLPLFPPILPPSSEVNDLLPASVHHLFSSAESRELSVGLAAAHALSSSSAASDSAGRPSSAPILESHSTEAHSDDLAKPTGGIARPVSSTKLRNGSARRSGSSKSRDEPAAANAFRPINGRSSPVPVT